MTKDELQNCFQQGKLGEVPLCKCYLKHPPPEPNLLHHSKVRNPHHVAEGKIHGSLEGHMRMLSSAHLCLLPESFPTYEDLPPTQVPASTI